MNKQDRKTLAEALLNLAPLCDSETIGLHSNEAITAAIDLCQGEVDSLAEAEREKYDNMSEGLQNSERGQALEEAADALEACSSCLTEARDLIGDKPEENRSEDELTAISEKLQEAVDEADGI